MAKILVTGGLGFIGRPCVTRLLDLGCAVAVLDSLIPEVHGPRPGLDRLTAGWPAGVEVAVGSVTDREQVSRAVAGATGVLHLASLTSVPGSMHDPTRYCRENVLGTSILCEAVRDAGSVGHLVLASSRAVYGEGRYRCRGECGDVTLAVRRSERLLATGRWEPLCPSCGGPLEFRPAREDDPLVPSSVYGMTKVSQEDLLRVGLGAAGVPVTAFRLQNVYGPGQDRHQPDVGVANIFARRVLAGGSLDLYEDGEPERDFVFVEDVADLLVRALLGPPPEEAFAAFNVGSGVATSLRGLAEAIFAAAGRQPSHRATGEYRVGDIRRSVADLDRLRAAWPWKPTPLEQGTARLVEALRS